MSVMRHCLRASLKIAWGRAERDFVMCQGGEGPCRTGHGASPQRAVRAEPTQAGGKKSDALRVFAGKAGWLRGSSVEDPPGIFSFVAPCHPTFPTKTGPHEIFRQALSLSSVTVAWLMICGTFVSSLAQTGHSTNFPTSEAELDLKKLQVAPGLKIELFASEPQLANPVAISVDEKGRVFVAETHRYKSSIFDITQHTPWLQDDLSFRSVNDRAAFLARTFSTNFSILTNQSELVRLVEDRNGDGRADASSVFATGFNESVSGTAAGVLAHHGQVWFASVPDLWLLSGTNNVAAQKTRLHTGYGVHIGVTGHDLHGLILGPDGKLYFSSGDRGFVVTNKEGNVLNYPDTGGVLRCDPDGSNLEVFAYGLRNPQELAFDAFGNLFTDDNDTAGEDKSRLIHVVEGADYGWRCSYQHMTGFGPWVQENVWRGNIDDVLPWSGEVAQGPAGLAFYPGTGLPESFQNHFLVCDFPGGIWSFDVKPRGASFELVKKEKFLWNLWPTDVTFGPDGAVYVSDWVAGWQMPDKGRIYRITDPALTGDSTLAAVKKMLNDGLSSKSDKELLELLGHSDQRVRLQAQSRLIDLHAVQDLVSVLAVERPALVKIHALWALDQLGRTLPTAAVPVIQAFLGQLASPDLNVRAQAAKMIGNIHATTASDNLVPLLNDPSARVRFETAQALGKLGDKSAIDPILALLRDNNDQDAYLTHAGVTALLRLADTNVLATAARDSSAAIRRAALLVMRRQQNPAIVRFLNDFEPRIVYEAARAINDVPIDDAMPELAKWLTKVDCPTNILSRALNANFRIGKEPNAKVLAAFARRVDMPDAMRAEALGALADWANPSPIDRVMGLYRPLPRRTLVHAQRAFLAVAGDIFAARSIPVQLAAIKTAAALKTKEVAERLFEKFQSAGTPIDLRREIPSLLAALSYYDLPAALKLALADPDRTIRQAAIQILDQTTLPDTATLLDQLMNTEPDLRLKQAALATLGRMQDPQAEKSLIKQLDLLLGGQIRPELQLDILDAAAAKNSPSIKERIARYETSLPKSDALASWRISLAGGDAAHGKTIFQQREDVACLRCHAINKVGGIVGPDLAGIAKRLSAEQILESIVLPNKSIAAGYENVVITMKDKVSYAGLIKSENDNALVLESPEDGNVILKKNEILNRVRGLSAMPEDLTKFLTRRDLRDLVAYLETLK